MKRFKILLFVCLCLTNVGLKGQDVDSISSDPRACYQFFEKMLKPQKTKIAALTLAEFKRQQEEQQLSKAHYQALALIGNKLLKHTQKAIVFQYLLTIINTFSKDKQLSFSELEKWLRITRQFLDKTTANTKVEDYLKWVSIFLETGQLYEAPKAVHQWLASSSSFDWSYEEGRLAVNYSKTNLYCYAQKDSLSILNTQGSYFPLEKHWEGLGGRVNWRKKDQQSPYALLGEYQINTVHDFYSASEVRLYNWFGNAPPLQGVLDHKIRKRSIASFRHPIFKSAIAELEQERKGIKAKGGWILEGEKLQLLGKVDTTATIYLQNKAQRRIAKIESAAFDWLKNGQIQSLAATTTLYLHGVNGSLDSICHPEINFLYDPKLRTILLTRTQRKISEVAYANSLQAMNITANRVEWQIDSNTIAFGDNNQNALFSSEAYFDEGLVTAYQSLGMVNPLIKMGLYGIKLNASIDTNLNPSEHWLDANDLALVLDKRMEKVILMTSNEIQRARKNTSFKIIEEQQDFSDFMRGSGLLYRFAAMDVKKMPTLIANSTFNKETTLPLYLRMEKDGFLIYNKSKGRLRLRKKLFHYITSTNRQKIEHDYDKIRLLALPSNSKSKKNNAVLNIDKKELAVFGVRQFLLSDSQQVFVQPQKTVRCLEKGNLHFEGQLSAGNCDFLGRDFKFNYTTYQVGLEKIDRLNFFIYKRKKYNNQWAQQKENSPPARAVDSQGNPTRELEAIQTVLEGAKGVLSIDSPTNKSGRKKSATKFPSFESTTFSRAYYDQRNLQGKNSYPRATFYYQLEPFVLNALDELKPAQLSFNGSLYAANIFAPITTPLRVMYHDLSLGFRMLIPNHKPEAIYCRHLKNGLGTFSGVLELSNAGLMGKGRFSCLGASMLANAITFLPELLTANAVEQFSLSASVQAGIEFPRVEGENIKVRWLPYQDSLCLNSALGEGFPFRLFEQQNCSLDGQLTLTTEGLKGRGTFDWSGATIESNPKGDYEFGQNGLSSSSAAVILKANGAQKFGFENENVALKIDFKQKIADFIVQEENLITELPYNKYQTSLDQFHWNMATNHILMERTNGKKGFFLATEAAQDALKFKGTKADYNLETGQLKIDGVDYIRVADAFIYPNKGQVLLEGAAKLKPLKGAIVIADTLHQNHLIQDAEISILNKNAYKGKGFLTFDWGNGRLQKIALPNLQTQRVSEHESVTTAEGKIDESASFYLGQHLQFKGKVKLYAQSKLLSFEGEAKLASSIFPNQQWFPIQSSIDKQNVYLQLQRSKQLSNKNLYTGLYLNLDSIGLYTTILGAPKRASDRAIFETIDIFKFDSEHGNYCWGSAARLLAGNTVGDVLKINEQRQKVVIDGRFNWDKGFNKKGMPQIGLDMVGNCTYLLNSEKDCHFEITMGIDFKLPTVLKALMVADFLSDENLKHPLDYNRINKLDFAQHLQNWIKDKNLFDRLWKRFKNQGDLQLPKNKRQDFFFIHNPLFWNAKTMSFQSKNKSLQLVSIGSQHLGQLVDGKLAILPNDRDGDALIYYLTAASGNWYYFHYQNGKLITVSNNPIYNKAITNLKRKERLVTTANGNTLELVLGTLKMYDVFKKKMIDQF
ncbi:hypothetical protein [Aureispira anguillae]|uniref:Uncharacterized protein n=1 Tax=Aureispira anguillae TaxID=2864201 RepID=A0A915YEI4_9BACT|nr:hypothetical protein [Aureispira anguillae]BDS11660.1 hypothetical protein AsAng_0023740 [Aureispira anguillae]